MLLKRNVVFHEGLKIFALPYHVVNGLLSVLEMVPRMTLQLITQSSEQAIAVKTKMLVKVFQNCLSSPNADVSRLPPDT